MLRQLQVFHSTMTRLKGGGACQGLSLSFQHKAALHCCFIRVDV